MTRTGEQLKCNGFCSYGANLEPHTDRKEYYVSGKVTALFPPPKETPNNPTKKTPNSSADTETS